MRRAGERQRAVGLVCLVIMPVLQVRARPERSEGGAIDDSATRYDRREFGVALVRGIS